MYAAAMLDLNYHHLYYFWAVAREGTIAAACAKLHVAQPTISTQLRLLETTLGVRLFHRSGRRLTLTEAGRVAFRYADDIFETGRELLDTLRGRPAQRTLTFQVGVADVLPKLVAYRLLQPAFALPDPMRLICVEAEPADLLARLSVYELDVVLSDSPIPPQVKVRAFNHLLGECGVSVFGTAALANRYRRGFPQSLRGAPLLVPGVNSVLRRSIDGWLDTHEIRPHIVGEFEDSALLKVFGQTGAGLFIAHDVIEAELRAQYGARPLGPLPGIREQFYAISVERKMRHPAVAAIATAARETMGG